MIDNLTLSGWIMRGIAVIISLTIHEFAHGLVSHLQGDDTAHRQGRLTMNPMAHIDVFGLIALFLFRFGWAKPIPFDPRNYRKPRIGIALTAIAGPLANLLLAFSTIVVMLLMPTNSEAVQLFLTELIFINTSLAIFNMIPVPPLDGSKILASIFGKSIERIFYRIEGKGILVIFLLLYIPVVNQALSKTIYSAVELLFRIAMTVTFQG